MTTLSTQLLSRYHCSTEDDWVNAIREVMQELALQGLWRAKFFEHAAFYGGTALRVLYGLPRSSEDLDFSLLEAGDFRWSAFAGALEAEMAAYGFQTEFFSKERPAFSSIDSAFLKSNTKMQLISVGVPKELAKHVHPGKEIKIKLEIDIEPPPDFQTEVKPLMWPSPHSIRAYTLPDLLAGKLHAVLCRKWKNRIKGRDWFDMVWYAGNHPKVSLRHLESRLRQSQNYHFEGALTLERLKELLREAVQNVDIDSIRQDVLPFLKDRREIEIWSKEFFLQVIEFFQE